MERVDDDGAGGEVGHHEINFPPSSPSLHLRVHKLDALTRIHLVRKFYPCCTSTWLCVIFTYSSLMSLS